MGWSCAVLPYAEWSVRLQLLFSRTFAASCQTVLLDVTMHRYYRDRCCNTGPEDLGLHGVCVQATKEFLELARGAAMTSSRQRRNSVPRSPARRSMVCRREVGPEIAGTRVAQAGDSGLRYPSQRNNTGISTTGKQLTARRGGDISHIQKKFV